MIEQAKLQGVSQKHVCETIGLQDRRVQRWRRFLQERGDLQDHRPGPQRAPHRLLESEKEAILQQARLEAFCDASSRILAYEALDRGILGVCASSVYRTLRQAGWTGERGRARRRTPRGSALVRLQLTGPNQRWCWDITYLRTLVKYSFVYLYVMLDEWSRKVVAWLVAPMESYEMGKLLMDRALGSEGLLEGGAVLPVVVNDRGPSMKAKSLRQFFQDLGVQQIFARPRTPNDNPFVEAAFRTIKYHPGYPGKFEDALQAQEYFGWFFEWYNHRHLHSGIGHVAPALRHAGKDGWIQECRRKRLEEARSRRLEVNRRASIIHVPGAPVPVGP